MIEETVELRKTSEDKRKEQQQKIGKAVDNMLKDVKSIDAIDPNTGQTTTIDLSVFNLGGANVN